MTTITQRLREIADTTEQYSDRHSRWVAENLRAIAAELEAPAADAALPPLPDAFAYGPTIDCPGAICEQQRQRYFSVNQMRDYARATVAALQEQINTAKHLDDPRLQEIFGCAIDGALTIGYQGGAAAANGHWLKPWWEKGRAVAEREAALQERISELEAGVDRELMRAAISARDARIADMEARINALEAQMTCHDGMAAIEHALEELVDRCNNDAFLSTDESVIRAEAALERCHIARRLASSRLAPKSAEDEYMVVWPDGSRFVASTLKSAQDYMSGAILSCAARGVEPPVIVRYAPAETVPYEPQQDSSKERP